MRTKITADKEKAKALRKMAKITLERLEKTNIEKYPSNTLVDYYDIIHKLLEATTLQEGTKIKGEGAHKELIDYCAKKIPLTEQTRQFLQRLRDYRNRIAYEGFMVRAEFIKTNNKEIKKIIKEILEKW